MSTLMTIAIFVSVCIAFFGAGALADIVYERSLVYCNEPGCKRFLTGKERLGDHDRKRHGEKWPEGRSLLDFTRAYYINSRIRLKWSVRQLIWTAIALAASLCMVNIAMRFFV